MTSQAAETARRVSRPATTPRSSGLVIGVAGIAAIAFGALLPVAPRAAVAALVVIPLALAAPVVTVSILIAVTVLVPFDAQDAFAVIGGSDRPGLLLVDALVLIGLLRVGWLVVRGRLEVDLPFLVAVAIGGICTAALLWGIALGAPVTEAGHEARRATLGVGAFLLAWPLMRDRTARRQLVRVLMGVGLVLALWGLTQWLFSLDYTTQGDVGVRPGVDLTSSGRGQLQGGMYAFPVAVILAWAALVSGVVRHVAARWLLGAILILNGVCLVLTFERTLWVATVMGCALVVVKAGAPARLPALRWAAVGVVALMGAAVVSPGEAQTALERLMSIAQVSTDNSFTSRVVESRAVGEAIAERPITGSGFGTTVTWGDQHEFATVTTSWVHNGYLWLGWKIGIPAAVLVVLPLCWAVVRRAPRRESDEWRMMRIGSQAAVFGLLLVAMTFSVFDVLGVTTVLGLLVAVCYSREDDRGSPPSAQPDAQAARVTLTPKPVEVDVVIPTRDRPAQLAATLTALGRQTFDRFGVIVVDDGGTSEAEHQVPDAARGSLALRFVRNDVSLGPGASRNRGANASTARYLVFLDDDCVADADLVSRHRNVLASGGPVVSLGPIVSPPGRRLPPWTHWDADRLEREYARLSNGETGPAWTHLYSGNVGIRREDFVGVGGFDERFARQEDVELGYRLARLGCRFEANTAAVVWHDSTRTLREWIRIPAASARFDVLIDRLDPDSARLSALREELGHRHWALRLARRLVRSPLVHRWTVLAAIGAGYVLHAVRADRAALAAFSLVWDLTYDQALREAMSEPAPAPAARPVGRHRG